jgi:hypothetical protein
MRKILGKIVVLSTILLLLSCDKDFNTIGSEIIGDGHYEFDKYTVQNLKAYSKETGAVQSNNLPVNSLGVYDDPFFGKTTSTFVSQLELERVAPNFGLDVEIKNIDSVYLYVPYFSRRQPPVAVGNEPNTFRLDSIYGNIETSINLGIYESNYFIRNFDAVNPEVSQKYYSDEINLIEDNLTTVNPLNNSASTIQNSAFKFSKNEILIYKTNENGVKIDNDGQPILNAEDWIVKERLDPGIFVDLDKGYFFNRILQASATNLSSNNNFKEYFKGLYFKAQQNSGQSGAMAQLDFSKAYIVIQYHSRNTAADPITKKSFRLNLRGNTINFFDNQFNTVYSDAIATSSFSSGDEKVYIKGGNGSVAFIDLFGTDDVDNNNVPDELDNLRLNKWLINDAILTMYVSNENQKQPKRIFLYDATNNIPLLDYFQDITTSGDTKNNKFVFGGLLESETSAGGVKYRFRIRAHINKILNSTNPNDLKNIRLGLVVTENINSIINNNLKSSFSYPVLLPTGTSDLVTNSIPMASIMNPLGTILYGTNVASGEEDKKMKLEIYYTKPN